MSSFDIIIVGAGLSGINTAYRLQKQMPGRSFAILEARGRVGGTWDFWNYPGFRCDSPMAVYAPVWHPWNDSRMIVDGHEIRAYLEDAASAAGIDKKIRFRHRVAAASWSSERQRWVMDVDASDDDPAGAERRVFDAKFVIWCSGYYDYTKPLDAKIPGLDSFGGQVVHPQFWDRAKVDIAGKRVVVVGSGATAVTLLPALVKTAAHVTMLQRSPSYVVPAPARDGLVGFAARWLPASWAARLSWWRVFMLGESLPVALMTTFPRLGRWLLMRATQKCLPPGVDIATHFSPRYHPFDQRVCFCPDGDFFDALARPNCDIVTDTIDAVTASGIRTASGRVLDADVIVTATGLTMAAFGGAAVSVDGVPVNESLGSRFFWNAVMVEGIPNAGLVLGYTTNTWTPGADARARLLLSVLAHMDRAGASTAAPEVDPRVRESLPRKAALPNSSTYIVAASNRLPKVAGVGPWRYPMHWFADVRTLLFGSVTKGMRYTAGRLKSD